MNKKILSLAFASALILAGCQDGGNEGSAGGENIQAPASQSTSSQADESANESQNSQTDDDNADDQNEGGSASSSSTEVTIESLPVTMEQAIETFQAEFPEVQITSIDIDRDSGSYTYEIQGETNQYEYDLEIDAQTGDIIKREEDRENDDMDTPLDLANVISVQEAIQIARDNGLGEIDDLELSVDDGVHQWHVEDTGDLEIEIDALTGAVLELDD